MITRIEISGFKSFWDFQMDFAPFTVVSGINASGKSNLFDALRLLSSLSTKDMRTAFSEEGQRGEMEELFSSFSGGHKTNEMYFAVEMLVPRKVKDNWGQEAEINTPRLRYELTISRREDETGMVELCVTHEQLSKIPQTQDSWVKYYLKERKEIWGTRRAGGSSNPYISTEKENDIVTIKLRQDLHQGGRNRVANTINQTVLSSVTSTEFPHVFAARQEMSGWKYMQLNPEVLREPSKMALGVENTVGANGSGMAAALYRMKTENPFYITLVSQKLCSFLREYQKVDVRRDDANKMYVVELTNQQGVQFSSRVLSEGTLRLLALCVMMYDPKHEGLLCYEEPENGIHPGRLGQMITLLHELASDFDDEEPILRQVVINTHSPWVMRQLMTLCKDNKDIKMLYSKATTIVLPSVEGSRMMNVTHMEEVTQALQTELKLSPTQRLFVQEVNELLEGKEPAL